MSTEILITGALVFIAQVLGLSLGTIRTVITVLGETRAAFLLGTLEMLLWVLGTSTVIAQVGEAPLIGVCYALGFATGNVVGIYAERKLALGNVVVRIISPALGPDIADAVRSAGYSITTVPGVGGEGPVTVQFVVCRRRDMKDVLSIAHQVDADIFYTFETAAGVNKIKSPARQQKLVPDMVRP